MSIKEHDRQYDIVVFGATGYTGKLTAEYITTNLPTDLKWAVAGRSESKLQDVVDECKKLNSDRAPPAIEVANLNDNDLAALAKKTCVLLTTVGPYALYGEYAFKACAENGTHYIDVTGEAPWVYKMIKKYEKVAKETGANLFPQSGVESAPSDLTTWALAKAVRTKFGVPVKEVKISLHNISSTPSGGTYLSGMTLFDAFTREEIKEATRPFALSPIPHTGPSVPQDTIFEKIFGVRTIPNLGTLTTSPVGRADGAIVERTWGLLSETPSRKDEFYGPNFTWVQYLKTRNVLTGVFIHWLLIIGIALIAYVQPFRALIKNLVFQPGEGAKREDTANDEIEYRGVAYPDSEKHRGKVAFCRAYHRGPMYHFTGKLMAEAALTILEDDIQLDGGVFTPACLGQSFIDRLYKADFKIEAKVIDA